VVVVVGLAVLMVIAAIRIVQEYERGVIFRPDESWHVDVPCSRRAPPFLDRFGPDGARAQG
jgi:regulator of protease activity HflC (stomatin/prohibitin superfamily)